MADSEANELLEEQQGSKQAQERKEEEKEEEQIVLSLPKCPRPNFAARHWKSIIFPSPKRLVLGRTPPSFTDSHCC